MATRWLTPLTPLLLLLGAGQIHAMNAIPPSASSTPPTPGIYRDFPLSPAEAASIPQPGTNAFTLHPRFTEAFAQVQELVHRTGNTSLLAASNIAHRAWDEATFYTEREAYRLGWREARREGLPGGSVRLTFWRVSAAKLSQVVVTFQGGALSVYPTVQPSPGWGDTTYAFSELPAPPMAGEAFPLCLTAAAKARVKHAGDTWSVTCAPEDPARSALQLARLFGWSAVKFDPKARVSTFQRGESFATASTAGAQVKVTLVGKAREKALLKQFPALPEGLRVHAVSSTGLISGGTYLPGPYRLELSNAKITAVAKGGSVALWPIKDAPAVPAEAVFDRMTEPGYWPTLRLITADGAVVDIRAKDQGVDKCVAQISRILAGKGDEDAHVHQLLAQSGWSKVPDATAREIVQRWIAAKSPATPAASEATRPSR